MNPFLITNISRLTKEEVCNRLKILRREVKVLERRHLQMDNDEMSNKIRDTIKVGMLFKNDLKTFQCKVTKVSKVGFSHSDYWYFEVTELPEPRRVSKFDFSTPCSWTVWPSNARRFFKDYEEIKVVDEKLLDRTED